MRFRLLAALIFAMAACSAFADKVVLGNLGQTTVGVAIHSTMSTQSRVYYRARPYEYLVVRPTPVSRWLRVVMQNGMYGYVISDSVAKLPYQVTVERPNRDVGSATSRGRVAQEALQYEGTPYVWGGNDLQNGIDCSGFVKKLFGEIGMNLPRTAAQQVNVGQPVTRLQDLEPGDRLYFWEAKRGKIGHTGIYLGKGYFVHSSMGRHGVATDYLGSKSWLKLLVAARR